MALVTNLQNIPDRVPVIGVGEYNGNVVSAEIKPPEGKRLERVEVSFQITTDCPDKGKRISENFTLAGDQGLENANSFTSVRFKQLCKALGIGEANSIEASDLIGKSCRFTVVHNPGRSADGTATEYANIKTFVSV